MAGREILRYKSMTGIPLEALLSRAGISPRTWREWMRRRGVETKHNNNIPKNYHLTPEEIKAVTGYCAENPLKGCRVLCYGMPDKNVASVSCGNVYNVIITTRNGFTGRSCI